MFQLRMTTGNAAFDDDCGQEIARILRYIARDVVDGKLEGKCVDYNGNIVGDWTYTDK